MTSTATISSLVDALFVERINGSDRAYYRKTKRSSYLKKDASSLSSARAKPAMCVSHRTNSRQKSL